MSKRTLAAVLAGTLALTIGITASSASAATAGWMVNGAFATGTGALAPTAAVTEGMKLEVVGASISCSSTIKHTEGETHWNLLIWLLKDKWLECKTAAPCELASPTVESVPLKAELTLEGALADRAVVTPKTKNVLATIKFEGESCALLGVQAITGKMTVRLPEGQDERTLQAVSANISSATGELKLGSAAASLKEAYLLKLLSGQTWSFL